MEKKKVTPVQHAKALADTQRELAEAKEQIKHLDQIVKNGSIMIQDLNKVIEHGEKVNNDLRRKNGLLMEVRPLISNLLSNHESVVAAMHKINEASYQTGTTNGCSPEPGWKSQHGMPR